MKWLLTAKGKLTLLLWLVAIHSFCVGIGLIIQVPTVMDFFGYGSIKQHFFPAQGGIFHIVMACGYILAACDLKEFRGLVIFSMIVKASATVFLLVYYFAVEQIWSVFASGIGDGLMMIFLLGGWVLYCNEEAGIQDAAVERKNTAEHSANC